MKPIDVLHKKNATKTQLRIALAEVLGVELTQIELEQKPQTDFKKCLDFFLEDYKKTTGIDYSFSTKDGVALKSIIVKIEEITTINDPVTTFFYLIKHLPDWYKKNAFSLTVINSKFNEIISSIKVQSSKTQKAYDTVSKATELGFTSIKKPT